MSKYNWKNIKGVGLGIVAFEATEHLANIISEVRDTFDYVTIGLQRMSYHGDPIDPTDLAEIFRLRDEDHLVDNILEISLDTSKAPRIQETDKRNLLVQDIEDHGCSHALIIDSDEYYTNQTVLKALVEIDKNDYEITYCQYANYYHDYQHFLVYPFQEGMYVPFITKTKYRFYFECVDFTLPSDPTRRYVRPFDAYIPVHTDVNIGLINNYDPDKIWDSLMKQLAEKQPMLTIDQIKSAAVLYITRQVRNKLNNQKVVLPKAAVDKIYNKVGHSLAKKYSVEYHVFDWKTVRMHHLSCIRADIRKKFNNWSSKTCFDNYNELIDKAVDAYNNFDPNSKEQQTASLLFGTPEHKVFVRAFDKQYIHPKYDIMERYQIVKDYKKIAIMNLSSTNSSNGLFEKLENTCKETWAKDAIDGKYDNIEYWTVIDTAKDSYIDKEKHTIFIKTDYSQDNTQQLLMRWLLAFEMLENAGYKYDWVLRTNTSTWCNVELINEFLAYETDDSALYAFKLFSAFWSTFNLYMSGAGMLWNVRNIRELRKMVDRTAKETLDIALDDVMMSVLWKKRADILELSNPGRQFHSLEGKHLPDTDKNTDYDSIDFIAPMFQIKTFQNDHGTYAGGSTHALRLSNDILKMQKVNELWESRRTSYDIEQLAKDLRNNMDKTINVIKYSKAEWLADNVIPEEERARQPIKTERPFNQETLDFIHQRAIDCGYIKE